MKKLLTCLFASALLAMVVPAHAEVKPNTFAISPYIGGYTFDGTQHLETNPVYGIRLGYNITEHWGVEGSFGDTPTKLTKRPDLVTFQANGRGGVTPVPFIIYNQKTDVNTLTYGLDLLYHFMPEKKLVPFLAVGGRGFYADYPAGLKDEITGALDYGGGVKYFFTDSDRWALRGDVRGLLLFDNMRSNVEYSVGLNYNFGIPKPPPPPCCPEPPPCPAPPPPPPPVQEKVQAPPPPPPPAPKKVCITLNIEFEFDKAVIRPQYFGEVEKVSDFMKKYPEVNAVIEGHTDNKGSYQYNMKLSQRRANSVMKMLIDKYGIAKSRLSAKGYGYTKPIAPNKNPDGTDNPEGRQKNRRIDAIIDCVLVPQ